MQKIQSGEKKGGKEDRKVAKTGLKCVVERECERVINEIDEETARKPSVNDFSRIPVSESEYNRASLDSASFIESP